jgi:hypothetical protein
MINPIGVDMLRPTGLQRSAGSHYECVPSWQGNRKEYATCVGRANEPTQSYISSAEYPRMRGVSRDVLWRAPYWGCALK